MSNEPPVRVDKNLFAMDPPNSVDEAWEIFERMIRAAETQDETVLRQKKRAFYSGVSFGIAHILTKCNNAHDVNHLLSDVLRYLRPCGPCGAANGAPTDDPKGAN